MKVVAVSGSLRSPSNTENALRLALEGAVEAGAEGRFVALRDLSLPWCDGRPDEQTYGPQTEAWRAAVAESDALIVGSPEYHGSLTGSLKNALDLLGPDLMRGKLVGLVATARGEAGAMNTLNHLRHICRWMDAWVLPKQVSVPRTQEAFGPDGRILREGLPEELRALGAELVRYAGLLSAK